MRDMEEFHVKRVDEITNFYQKKFEEKAEEAKKLKSKCVQLGKDFQTSLVEMEANADQEIISIQHSFEEKMKEERESLSSIREENITMRSRFEMLTKEIEERKVELTKTMQEEKRLHGIIKGLDKDIIGVKREVSKRESVVSEIF